MKRIIYALICPFTGDIHYIGKSIRNMTRPMQYIKKSHSNKIEKWVSDLKCLGQKPDIKILERVSLEDDLDERESYWLQKYLSKGEFLFNINKVSPILVNSKLEKFLQDLDLGDISDISFFIKERRKLVGLKQSDFADKAGVSLTVIRKIEQGKININLVGLLQVLSMFGCRLGVVKY